MKFLCLFLLAVFGTLLLFATVIFYEPPAFVGYIFGFFNGAAWIGLMALHAIRGKSND